jgi:hypothetical protein
MTFITRAVVSGLAELAGWPCVHLGRVAIGPGETSWDRILPLATPADRRRLAAALGGRLVAVLAPAKVRAWREVRRGQPKETPAERFARLRRDLPIFGDAAAVQPVLAALLRLPSAVADYVARTSMVLAVGGSCGGWTGPLLPADRKPIVLDLHTSDVVDLMVHEAAHRWTAPDPPGQMLRTSDEQAGVLHYCEEERARMERDERVARLLTAAWSCRGGK